MFKKILKGRHEAPPPNKAAQAPPPGAGGFQPPARPQPQHYGGSTQTPSYSTNPVEYETSSPGFDPGLSSYRENVSLDPVEYKNSGPGYVHRPPGSTLPVEYNTSGPGYVHRPPGSTLPVEYNTSGPGYARGRPVGSALPVEYAMSPPGLAPPQGRNNPTSPAPVDYSINTPVHMAGQATNPLPQNMQKSPRLSQHQQPPPKQYEYRAYHAPAPPSPATPQQHWPTDPNTKYAYCPPPSPRGQAPVEMPAVNSPAPIELPASAVAPRYEMPAVSSARLSPVPPYSPPRHSPNPGWSSPTNTSTTFGSTTTLVPSPRSGPASPMFGDQKMVTVPAQGQTQGEDGIKKYVVDIYCPLKRDAHGNRREQLPRDVREFRLAKVALIPIIAGKRSFVSLDVVFGEIDKSFADLVEKHFSFCHQTRMTKLDPNAIAGGQVYSVGPLNIAYRDGDQSTVYLKFPKQEDKNRFKTDFFEMWRYVEQTAV